MTSPLPGIEVQSEELLSDYVVRDGFLGTGVAPAERCYGSRYRAKSACPVEDEDGSDCRLDSWHDVVPGSGVYRSRETRVCPLA